MEESRHNAVVESLEKDTTLGGEGKRLQLGRAKALRNHHVAQINQDQLLELNEIDGLVIEKLQAEVMTFRRKLQAVKAVMVDKNLNRQERKRKGALEQVMQNKQNLQNQIDRIEAQYQKQLDALDIERMDAETLKAEMQKLTSQK